MAAERKRGKELEVAILEAAYDIIQTYGYENMTFQNVAKQAQTSRTVIYSHYTNKAELLYALVQYRFRQALGEKMIDLVQKKGSLRADLLAAVELYQQFLEAVGAELMSAILYELSQRNEKFRLFSIRGLESNIEVMEKIQAFAIQRGDLKHELSIMQMSLPFDLLRFENMMRGGKVSKEYLTQLVDDVLMPIYTAET
ncbi:TetR/AcrR family transcriptional regulator [Paenibacillus sp. WQ 127069]|uniref:TetR/AcrR family transcriptional regulator n=1 Tax=Paenibacillus baimaensis TaxID=2982185 RepID=A0ABT2UD03_9BACL|nr:TetR/AcrR family transcriptional regulator [Paenibacillus sp. WQ 127069]MCU6792523.1 TetR/AcrR family transcriptional regulator [Paenibacillus sp. WQ 127069]